MPEFILLILALLLVGTPEASIVFVLLAIGSSVWRQNRFRSEFEEWKARVNSERESLRRELAELRSELRTKSSSAAVEIAVSGSTEVAKPAEPTRKAVPPVAATSPLPVAQPTPVQQPRAPEFEIAVATSARADVEIASPRAETSRSAGVKIPTTAPLASPAVRVEPKSPAQVTSPTVPATEIRGVVSPAASTSIHPEAPSEPRPQQPGATATPARLAAPTHVTTPHVEVDDKIPSRKPAVPHKTLGEQIKSALALEEVLGTNWLNKLGVVILVIGLAFFGIYELGQMGPLGRVVVLAGVAASLLGGGIFLERKKLFELIGKTLIGGGWALAFFTAYAMYHVGPMNVLGSQTFDLVLMLAVACGMVVHTLKYRSQWVTGIAFLLGFSTVALSHDTVYALTAGAILAAGLVAIVQKMCWYELEVFGILASYLNHIVWLYKILGPAGAQGRLFAEFVPSVSLLGFYWLVFRASYIWRKIRSAHDENVSSVATLLNTLLLLALAKFQSARPQLGFYALLTLGALEFACAQLPVIRKRRAAFIVLSLVGSVLMFIAVPFKFAGNSTAILWMGGAEIFLLAGVLLKEIVFRRIALFAGVAAGFYWASFSTVAVLRIRIGGDERLVLHEGIVLLTCAALYWINAYVVRERWGELFKGIEGNGIIIQAYLGGATAFVGCIALSSVSWGAVCWVLLGFLLAVLARKLREFSLIVQGLFFHAAGVAWLCARNLNLDRVYPAHDGARFVAFTASVLMLYAAAFVLYKDTRDETRMWRIFVSSSGTFTLVLLTKVETSWYWHPALWMAVALVLAEVARKLRSLNLQVHTHAVAALALFTSTGLQFEVRPLWHGIRTPLIVVAPLVACIYWLTSRVAWKERREGVVVESLYAWTGTIFAAGLFFKLLPLEWVGMSWIAYGCALALTARWKKFACIEYHGPVLSAGAVPLLLIETLRSETHLGYLSARLVIVGISSALLYAVSRRAVASANRYAAPIARGYTWAATALLATLAFFEVQRPWLAFVWIAFALVLVAIDRWKHVEELPWQAQALAVLASVRVAGFDLQNSTLWHGISTRLLSVSAVVVALYCIAQWLRMPEQWRVKSIHHAYSWTASTFACWMMWFELKPVSVAVGWVLFGLLLFESGFIRKELQLRIQAYVAFTSAFARIFFVNLTAPSTAGERIGPAIYTVVPLALVFYFVYSQLQERGSAPELERWPADQLVAYFGSAVVASMLYFQIGGDWTLAAWATMLLALMTTAVMFKRPVFMEQSTLLTIAIIWRGITHNLFGSSYFDAQRWTGRFLVTGSAVALMFATLPLAFRLRAVHADSNEGLQRFRLLRTMTSYPDQLLFFAPILLLTLMLALRMRAGMVTVAWGLEGVIVFLFALAMKRRSYRLTGLVLLLLCVAKILAFDAWRLQPRDRYLTFIVLGAVLLGVSFLYSRYREMVRQYL